jgi:prophage regulatory protein
MRLLDYSDLRPRKGISYTRRHLKRKCDAGSFPKPIPVSDTKIAWIEEEIDDWLEARKRLRDETLAGKVRPPETR